MIPLDAFEGRQVLVTGGLGFVGSNLAIRLARAGAKVTVLDSLVPRFGGNLFNIAPAGDRVSVNISDMRDADSLAVLVQGKDYIFNLAGQVSHGDSMREPHLDLAVNCTSTVNLVEACRRHNPQARLLYTSTRQVYGRPGKLPVTEDHPTVPIDVNGINKLAAEQYHLLYHRTYGIRSTVLRLTNTFGPRQQIRGNHQGFVTIFLRRALRGETIELYDGGRQTRDFNYVDDVVNALLLAAVTDACYGQVYNLGSNRAYSLLEFVEVLKRLCPFTVTSVPFPEEKRIIDIGDYYGDYSKFRRTTGWEPRMELGEGLEKTVAFYRKHKEVYWQ